MAKTRINMIDLMNTAWSKKNSCSSDEFAEKIKNLLSHSFVEVERIYKDYCSRNGIKYDQQVFLVYQHIFIFLMKCDGEFLQGEYDAYLKYCDWANIQPLKVERVNELYNEMSVDVLTNDIKLLVGLRDSIDPENYEAMVQGFCYLSLSGDRCFDENEYYILRCFFEDGYDYQPSDWEQFKREWV